MSRLFSASQYDKAYSPKRNGNWEAPDEKKVAKPGASPVQKTADGRTIPIVDERGHIVKGGKKPSSAFVPSPAQQSAPRWPQHNPTWSGTAAATMGYKGIITDYLPSDTVVLKTVEKDGSRERNYAGGPH